MKSQVHLWISIPAKGDKEGGLTCHFRAKIDTGSDCSVVKSNALDRLAELDRGFLHKEALPPERYKGIGGPSNFLGKVALPVYLQDRPDTLHSSLFNVLDDTDDAPEFDFILGLDWLSMMAIQFRRLEEGAEMHSLVIQLIRNVQVRTKCMIVDQPGSQLMCG